MTKFSAGMQRVGLGYCPFLGGGSVAVVVDLLINTLPIVCGSSVFVFVLLRITYFESILVLQSSGGGRENWLLCF